MTDAFWSLMIISAVWTSSMDMPKAARMFFTAFWLLLFVVACVAKMIGDV